MDSPFFNHKNIHVVGIKGTGCAALAELLMSCSCTITGSDVPDVFYTDALLQKLGITYYTSFDAQHITDKCDIVIHSAAYDMNNPELAQAQAMGLPILSYAQALGLLSQSSYACAVAGVHGKTTTTALIGSVVKALALPASVLVGSAVKDFDDHAVLNLGDEFLIAETCEYRRHFLQYYPQIIVVTSVELDHQDYFKDVADIEQAFIEFGCRLPRDGVLIYCADDAGASRVAVEVQKQKPSVTLVPYGYTADSPWQISKVETQQGQKGVSFSVAGYDHRFVLQVPVLHNVLNATAALCVAHHLLALKRVNSKDSYNLARMATGLMSFQGTKRRCEIIGEKNGIIIMDDYGHHPTAIASTLQHLKESMQAKRLIVSFMSHTYSRTAALLDEFVASLDAADVLYLHKVYGSARESQDKSNIDEQLFHRCELRLLSRPVWYFAEPLDAKDHVLSILQEGDLFISVGAGNNFELAHRVYQDLSL